MVIPSDSNKRGLNSFVFNTNKTCANTKEYRGVQPKVFTEAGINSVQVSPTCNTASLPTTEEGSPGRGPLLPGRLGHHCDKEASANSKGRNIGSALTSRGRAADRYA